MQFHGRNLRVARLFRGLTQRALAERVSVSEAMVWQVERDKAPGANLAEALATALGMERGFFERPLADVLTDSDCHFRTRLTTHERVRKRVLAQGTLFAHLINHVRERRYVTLPAYNVPALAADTNATIEQAAGLCRAHWKLGSDAPVTHMGRVLENAGVMITRLPSGESTALDAFSRRGTGDTQSFVVLNPAKGSTSRTRFDMAHELGHLVLHGVTSADHGERERQANRFAGAFLLPQAAFRREFWSGGRTDWARVFSMKRRWKVSAQVIIYRAHHLDLIDAVEFRRAYKTMSDKGWIKSEPEEPAAETPELFKKMMRTLWTRRQIGGAELAHELHWSIKTFEDVTGLRTTDSVGPRPSALTLVGNRT